MVIIALGSLNARTKSLFWLIYPFTDVPWLPSWLGHQESASNMRDLGSIFASGRSAGEGNEWQTTLVFLPGDSHGERRLVGYSPWGTKESDTTEKLAHTQQIFLYPLVIKNESLVTSAFVCSSLVSWSSLHFNYLVLRIIEFILFILVTEI